MVKEVDKGRRNFVFGVLKKNSLEDQENLKVPSEKKGMSRRDFLIALSVGVGGLVLALYGYPLLENLFKRKEENQTSTSTSTTSKDREKPRISSVKAFLEKVDDEFKLKVNAEVSDNVKVDKVLISYRYDGYQANDLMKLIGENLYEDIQDIPFDFSDLDKTLEISLKAFDSSGNQSSLVKKVSIRQLVNEFDKQEPKIYDIEYKLLDPSELEIKAYADDDFGVKSLKGILTIDSNSIELTFEKIDSNKYRAIVQVPIDEETISLKVIAEDYLGKESTQLVSFTYLDLLKQIDNQIPVINYKIDFIAEDSKDYLAIEYSAKDNVKIKESYVKVNGELLENQLFEIDLNLVEDLDIQFYARDLAGNEASEEVYFEKDDLIKELFKSYVSSKGYTFNENELEQILSIDLVKELFKDYSLRENLESLFSYLSNNFEDGLNSIELISQELSNYRIYQAKKIFKELIKFLDEEEFYNVNQLNSKALVNYFDAVSLNGYPLNKNALKNLLDILDSEESKELINFKELRFHSVDGNDVVLKPKPYREIYVLSEFLYRLKQDGVDLKNYPKYFEAIREKIFANNFSAFDAEYGIKHYTKDLEPYSNEYLDLILLQWNYYSKFTPEFGDENLIYNRSFPWYDSSKLKEYYPDEEIRRQALFFLFYLPAATYDLKNKKVVSGLEGAKLSITQAWEEYLKIAELYPDGTLHHEIWGDVDVRFYYYDWIVDRCTPLSNPPRLVETGKQFVGIYADELWDIITQHPTDFWDYLKDYNGLDQFLTKNWDYWDYVKFAMGYGRWLDTGIEEYGIYFIIPDILRMMGYPTGHINIEPNPPGTGVSEWAVSLPQYIVDKLNNEFGSDSIVYGPGNIFGLYSAKDGLVKDGIKEIYVMIPRTNKWIYLMKSS